MLPTIEIDTEGNISTIYDDELLLERIGIIHNIRRASNIEFNEDWQIWEVICAKTKKVVFQSVSRNKCIEWEIKNFSPGGPHESF